MAPAYDLLLAGGIVLDPASGRNGRFDVAVRDGRIAAVEPHIAADAATRVLDVAGSYVTPGLVDFHIHAYWGVNPFGFDVDPVCATTGVTTAVDAGSAGPVNFLGFKRFIAEQARTRLLGFVCVAQHGVLTAPAELLDMRFADPEGAARKIEEHRDVAVGIKVRLDEAMVGGNGREALRLAIEAGEATHTPVMVHIGYTGITIEEIAETLRPGDVITHCYTPLAPSIVDEQLRVRPAVRRAHERGVLFDVGHAGRHLSYDIVRACVADGIVPHVISTDLHGLLKDGGPVVNLPTTLSKFLALGMSLDQVIAAATIAPARALGWDDRIGRLEVGRVADVAVLDVVRTPVTLRDSRGAEMTVDQHLKARHTIREGQVSDAPPARRDFA